jgi:YesN/AraC family two-component response regulator
MEQNETLRILIVDDVTETRRSMRLMMTQIPETRVIAIADNGRDAIELVREKKPDIAFVDVNMPGMNGLDAIERMLAVHPDLICIVVSAERDRFTLQKAMDVGASAYLIKPVTIDLLADKIEAVKDKIETSRARHAEVDKMRQERNQFLKQLADEYTRTRRVDAKAMAVFEELAQDPNCELRYLKTLAVIYIFRNRWTPLKDLAARLEIMM